MEGGDVNINNSLNITNVIKLKNYFMLSVNAY